MRKCGQRLGVPYRVVRVSLAARGEQAERGDHGRRNRRQHHAQPNRASDVHWVFYLSAHDPARLDLRPERVLDNREY
jgi:hypothetical protein